MAANGTQQSYLYQQRGQTDQYRDRSMEQSGSNSGNPYGYMPANVYQQSQPPQNRYIPPTFNPQTGQWNTAGQQYMTPGAYSGYSGQYDMQQGQGGSGYMPKTNFAAQPQQAPVGQPQKPGVATGTPAPGSGPTDAYMRPPRFSSNGLPASLQPAQAQPLAQGSTANPNSMPQNNQQAILPLIQALQQQQQQGQSGATGLSQSLGRYLPYLQR